MEKSTYTNHHHTYSDSTEELNRSAEEILNGVKRNVEVQAVNPPTALSFHESSMLGKLKIIKSYFFFPFGSHFQKKTKQTYVLLSTKYDIII